MNVSNKVRKSLIFGNVVYETIRMKSLKARADKEKFGLHKFVPSDLLKKYKLFSMCSKFMGLSRKRLSKLATSSVCVHRKTYQSKSLRASPVVLTFYERDDNSRIMTSRNNKITRKGQKKQRRLLLDDLKKLHQKYCNEHPLGKVSYTVFCKVRPFYILPPIACDRETCFCKTHENTKLMIMKLKLLKILLANSTGVGACIEQMVCQNPLHNCYVGRCDRCQDRINLMIVGHFDGDDETKWLQWTQISKSHEIKKK